MPKSCPSRPPLALLLLSSSLFLLHLHRWISNSNPIELQLEETVRRSLTTGGTFHIDTSRTIALQHCPCKRSLPGLNLEREPELLHSTCSHDSWARGSHQKVVAFSFYGSTNSTEHQKKKYWSGIEENLALVEALYGEGWSMRVYHDLLSSSPLHQQLCSLACSSTFLDLCPVAELPSSSPSNASSIFPMVWRFLPTLDPQVDLYLCRDLDSRISKREVAAVQEWLATDAAVHAMRDHPAHNVPLLGASWAAQLSQANIREKWRRSWQKMLADPLCWAPASAKGPDQELLTKYIWSWARHMAVQHDSYTCHTFPGSKGFPTEREDGENNFVGAVVSEGGGRLWKKCPKKCRRRREWERC